MGATSFLVEHITFQKSVTLLRDSGEHILLYYCAVEVLCVLLFVYISLLGQLQSEPINLYYA